MKRKKDITSGLTEFLTQHFINKGVQLYVEREYHYVEPGDCDADYEAVKVLEKHANIFLDAPAVICGAPLSCDMFAYKKHGNMEAVIFGPVGGNLHAPDEWVDINSLLIVIKSLAITIVDWCQKTE